jgi:phosphate transport system substrate-binding protein
MARLLGLPGAVLRSDCYAHADQDLVARYVAARAGAVGMVSLPWYQCARERLRLVPIAFAPDGAPSSPSPAALMDGAYGPLGRPLFFYLTTKSAGMPEVNAFVEYVLTHAVALTSGAGLAPFSPPVYEKVLGRVRGRQAGTFFRELRNDETRQSAHAR